MADTILAIWSKLVRPGAASFYFREVPCETAFRVVLRTYGLGSQVEVLR